MKIFALFSVVIFLMGCSTTTTRYRMAPVGVGQADRSQSKERAADAEVLGVHPVMAEESVCLIELLVEGAVDDFDFDEVTQEVADEPRENWQASYDERVIAKSASGATDAFFFHYLDLKRPLRTSAGLLPLPNPSPIPPHLRFMKYEAPD